MPALQADSTGPSNMSSQPAEANMAQSRSAAASNGASAGVSIQGRVGDNVRLYRSVSKPTRMHATPPSLPSSAAEVDPNVDRKLVARVQKGDKQAFDLLVIKYQGKIASIISRYVSDRQDIADVAQEAFIKAYRAIGSFRGDSAFYTWIYRIAINCAKNFLAAKGRRPQAADIEVEEAEHLPGGSQLRDLASPEHNLNRQQLEQVVNQAIADLPEDLRVALTLREFDGLSYEEIAAVMECPVGTVRSRIFRAREAVDTAIRPLMSGS